MDLPYLVRTAWLHAPNARVGRVELETRSAYCERYPFDKVADPPGTACRTSLMGHRLAATNWHPPHPPHIRMETPAAADYRGGGVAKRYEFVFLWSRNRPRIDEFSI
jgi:hypothetical protein